MNIAQDQPKSHGMTTVFIGIPYYLNIMWVTFKDLQGDMP